MKRKLSIFLAGILLSQTMGVMVVSAEEVTGVYADIYNISVNLDFETNEEEISLFLGETPVDINIISDGKNISVTPKNGYFETDKVYKLNVGDMEKEFKIKTLYSEKFEEMQDGIAEGTVSNFYGDMNFSQGDNGSVFYQDGKLVLADAFMSISDFEVAENGRLTFSADVEGYGKKGYKADGVSTYTANAGYVTGYMGIGNNDKFSVADSYAIELKNRSFRGGAFDGDEAYENTAESPNDYPNKGGYDDNRFGFSKVTDSEVKLQSYAYDTQSVSRSMAIRKDADMLYGLSDGDTLISFGDQHVGTDILSFMADYRTALVLDNILVTCYTEDVEEPEKGEVKALALDGDFSALYLSFDRTLKGTADFEKIHVYENDEEVESEISFGNDDLTVLKIVPESYSSGNTYKVLIEEGFGTKHMWTYEDYSFEKFLEPEYINVQDAYMNAEGITVSFNDKIPDGTDKSKIEVYKNNEKCLAEIELSEDKVLIMPEDYELNKIYKVVIPAGFGNKNVYLESEYSFEDEYVKAEITVEKVSGNSGVVYITMSKDISKLQDASKVSIYKDDEEIESKAEISGNVITLKASEDFVNDEIYEIYIGTFETEDAVMKKAYRKQFTMKEVIFEDFEDEEMAEGVSIGGKIIADGNKVSGVSEEDSEKNKRRIMWNGGLTVSHKDIVEAENYDITFDFQLFNANLNNDNKKYTDSVPYSNWYYNRKSSTETYKVYVNPSTTRGQIYNEKEGAWKDFSSTSYTAWANGDAYYDKNKDEIFIYDTGDELPFEKSGRTVSERSISEPREVKIIKNGKNFYAWSEGEQFISCEPGEEQPDYLTGEVTLQNQITEIVSFDNLSVRKFELIDSEEISISAVKLDSEINGVLNGSFKIGNFTEADKTLRAAVCAYGEDGFMQTIEILDISEVEAGEKELVEFSLDKVEGVKKVTIFIWKDLKGFENYTVYSIPVQ